MMIAENSRRHLKKLLHKEALWVAASAATIKDLRTRALAPDAQLSGRAKIFHLG
jgi:hypothetical protein